MSLSDDVAQRIREINHLRLQRACIAREERKRLSQAKLKRPSGAQKAKARRAIYSAVFAERSHEI